MIEEIKTGLYKIEIPLANSPLKALNSYLVTNPERNLIIDTGWNQKECLDAMQTALKKLGVDLRKTDFYITHIHSDHFGLVSKLAPKTSVIYMNQPDADRFRAGIQLDDFVRFARLNGFPEDELQAGLRSHPGFRYRPEENIVFHTVKEGDSIRIGDYAFNCVETPGHSWGHMCLYEPQKKILVAGDHILNDITPNIQLWDDQWNPLKKYLSSLDKVYKLDIELVLPGHRSIFRNCRERIQELKDHHRKRMDEIISILAEGPKNAFQIGPLMSWDIVYDSWDLFPVTQKWFAIGEVIAHLKYLEEEGVLRSETEKKKRVYSLNVKRK